MNDSLEVSVNGKRVCVPAGASAAVAILLARDGVVRASVAGSPRGALCGMGICLECRATVDGRPHQRTCQCEVRPGMEIVTDV